MQYVSYFSITYVYSRIARITNLLFITELQVIQLSNYCGITHVSVLYELQHCRHYRITLVAAYYAL
jgi:hypothetical protein